MKHGSVYHRHASACPRDGDGAFLPHRCRGPWAYALEYGRDSTGRRLQSTKSGFPTKSAAKSALQEMVTTLMADVSVHGLTVGQNLETWLAGKHALKSSTAAHYRDALTSTCCPTSAPAACSHSARTPRPLRRRHRGRRSRPPVEPELHPSGPCRAALRAQHTAVRRRLIPHNPALHIELAPENPRRPKPWTPEQCHKFLAHIANDRLATLYQLLLVTGLRAGEVIGLRWEDVDLDGACLFVVEQVLEVRGKLVVGTPKTKRGVRVLPLDAATIARLRRHQETKQLERAAWGSAGTDSGFVFTREDGRVLRPEYVTRHFQHLAKEAGLLAIRLHDLRHTNASVALAAGVEMKVVSERLGHSTTAITADLYTHVVPTVGRAAAERIADVLTPAADAVGEDVPDGFLASEASEGPGGRSDHASLQVERARPKGLERHCQDQRRRCAVDRDPER